MHYYIEIGSRVNNDGLVKRIQSWTGQDHVDIVITVHTPDADIMQSASGTQKSFKEALGWLTEKVQGPWPEEEK